MADSSELVVQTVRDKAKGEESDCMIKVSDNRFLKY